MSEMTGRFSEIVGNANLLTGDAIPEDYAHDEELTGPPQKPAYAAKPATPEEVAQLLKAASENGVPVTARGSGCGLSGAARPVEGGLLISFDRMNKVLEVDTANQVAVVQPGGGVDRPGRRYRRYRAAVHGLPGRAVLQRRRECRNQRRRDARGQVRSGPP